MNDLLRRLLTESITESRKLLDIALFVDLPNGLLQR